MISHGQLAQSLLKFSAMQARARDHISIRDSIHGSIFVNTNEIQAIDHPAFQRLRFIKQAGFIDLAFPGATHTRYAHSLGAMHMATRIFDSIFPDEQQLTGPVRLRLRQTLRLAALCHDLGHGPLSHSSEALMDGATHEDFTRRLLSDSPFSEALAKLFAHADIAPQHVVDLIFPDNNFDPGFFSFEGLNYRPILQQIVSSECDADRMDYLQRDSVYCGVNYGKFDTDWLVENLVAVEKDNALFLGLRSKAIFSFEDFLLSRYHMFASVYFHHTPIIFDKMLELHGRANDGFKLPKDIESYIQIDDVELLSFLRQSKCPYAKRIVERKPFYLIDEFKVDSENSEQITKHEQVAKRLRENGIPTIQSRSKSSLSKYFGKVPSSIWVLTSDGTVDLESYTPLYKRYLAPAELHRLFVSPEHKDRALLVMKNDQA